MYFFLKPAKRPLWSRLIKKEDSFMEIYFEPIKPLLTSFGCFMFYTLAYAVLIVLLRSIYLMYTTSTTINPKLRRLYQLDEAVKGILNRIKQALTKAVEIQEELDEIEAEIIEEEEAKERMVRRNLPCLLDSGSATSLPKLPPAIALPYKPTVEPILNDNEIYVKEDEEEKKLSQTDNIPKDQALNTELVSKIPITTANSDKPQLGTDNTMTVAPLLAHPERDPNVDFEHVEEPQMLRDYILKNAALADLNQVQTHPLFTCYWFEPILEPIEEENESNEETEIYDDKLGNLADKGSQTDSRIVEAQDFTQQVSEENFVGNSRKTLILRPFLKRKKSLHVNDRRWFP